MRRCTIDARFGMLVTAIKQAESQRNLPILSSFAPPFPLSNSSRHFFSMQ
jgi:hypothetical protein